MQRGQLKSRDWVKNFNLFANFTISCSNKIVSLRNFVYYVTITAISLTLLSLKSFYYLYSSPLSTIELTVSLCMLLKVICIMHLIIKHL